MNRTFVSIMLISTICLFTSCATNMPQGVWRNDEMNLILFIDSSYEAPQEMQNKHGIWFLGLHSTNEEVRKLTIWLSPTPHFSIYEINFHENGEVSRGDIVASGIHGIRRGKLHYRIVDFPAFGLERGEIIIFRRVSDYEPPDFDEWFP